MIATTLARYFAWRYVAALAAVLAGMFALVILIDFVESVRRTNTVPNASTWTVALISIYRVPQVMERILPFAVLIAAIACFLTLSRRLELVVARAAGLSAWQFITPALIATFVLGIAATALYNPLSSALRERSKRIEAEMSGSLPSVLQQTGAMFWVRQQSDDSQSILSATASREQGAWLGGVTAFKFDRAGRFLERIVASSAKLDSGRWLLDEARVYSTGAPPRDEAVYSLKTNMTLEQVRESFATPETLSFWELPSYIKIAEQAGLVAAGYRFQYHTLIAQPFLLLSMVILAAAVSLRFFRAGGVQGMILSGIGAGFLLYVLSKVTEDLSRAELMHPVAAAWLPVCVGGLAGVVVLLYQEDG